MRSLVVVLTATLCLAASGCSKNANPDTPPRPTGPEISEVGVKCPFGVSASDPDLDRVSVRVDWADGDTSDWSEMFGSGDTITLEHVWSVAGDFKVSVQARDDKDAKSLWSAWHLIAIADTVNLPPETPTAPAGPDTGYVATAYEFSASAREPDGESVRLRFDWGDGDTSDWSVPVPESTSVKMTHSWSGAGDFSIRVRAKDVNELVSDWSGVHILTVKDSLK